MKQIGQVIDEINRRVEVFTLCALNPDRSPHIAERELQRRDELVQLLKFIEGNQ